MAYQFKRWRDFENRAGKCRKMAAVKLESEFDRWDKIDAEDIPDFKHTQPEMYKRHWLERCEK